jgi:hypothetical protein
MKEFIIGIDNGPTGNFCILNLNDNKELYYFATPVKKEKSYTKKERYLNRLDHELLKSKLETIVKNNKCKAYMERPMIQSARFFSSISSIRCLEAECLILEQLGIPYEFLDSRIWQKEILVGIKGRDNLKLESKIVSSKLYPQFREQIKKDGDAILIAHYYKQKLLKERNSNGK